MTSTNHSPEETCEQELPPLPRSAEPRSFPEQTGDGIDARFQRALLQRELEEARSEVRKSKSGIEQRLDGKWDGFESLREDLERAKTEADNTTDVRRATDLLQWANDVSVRLDEAVPARNRLLSVRDRILAVDEHDCSEEMLNLRKRFVAAFDGTRFREAERLSSEWDPLSDGERERRRGLVRQALSKCRIDLRGLVGGGVPGAWTDVEAIQREIDRVTGSFGQGETFASIRAARGDVDSVSKSVSRLKDAWTRMAGAVQEAGADLQTNRDAERFFPEERIRLADKLQAFMSKATEFASSERMDEALREIRRAAETLKGRALARRKLSDHAGRLDKLLAEGVPESWPEVGRIRQAISQGTTYANQGETNQSERMVRNTEEWVGRLERNWKRLADGARDTLTGLQANLNAKRFFPEEWLRLVGTLRSFMATAGEFDSSERMDEALRGIKKSAASMADGTAKQIGRFDCLHRRIEAAASLARELDGEDGIDIPRSLGSAMETARHAERFDPHLESLAADFFNALRKELQDRCSLLLDPTKEEKVFALLKDFVDKLHDRARQFPEFDLPVAEILFLKWIQNGEETTELMESVGRAKPDRLERFSPRVGEERLHRASEGLKRILGNVPGLALPVALSRGKEAVFELANNGNREAEDYLASLFLENGRAAFGEIPERRVRAFLDRLSGRRPDEVFDRLGNADILDFALNGNRRAEERLLALFQEKGVAPFRKIPGGRPDEFFKGISDKHPNLSMRYFAETGNAAVLSDLASRHLQLVEKRVPSRFYQTTTRTVTRNGPGVWDKDVGWFVPSETWDEEVTSTVFCREKLEREARTNAEMAVVLGCRLFEELEQQRAKEQFKRAADCGNVDGMNNYAVLLCRKGRYAEAKPWFEKAADAGLETALKNLDLVRQLLPRRRQRQG